MKKYFNGTITPQYNRNFNYAGGLSGSVIFSALNNDWWLAAKEDDFSVVEAIFSVDDFILELIWEGGLSDFESALAADFFDGEPVEPSGDFEDAEMDLLSLSPSSWSRFSITVRWDLSSAGFNDLTQNSIR